MIAHARTRPGIVSSQVVLAIGLLLAWEWGSTTGHLDPFFFSRPSQVALRVWQWVATGALWLHVSTTFAEALLSFAIGASLGIIFGFSLASLPVLAAIVEPYVRIANALPRVVLAPVFLLWFGLGIWSKVALGVTVVFFVVFFNAYRAVREVEANLSRRISRLEGEVADHSGHIQDLRSKSVEAEQSMGRLLSAVEGFCEQAATRLETVTAPALAARRATTPMRRSARASWFRG